MCIRGRKIKQYIYHKKREIATDYFEVPYIDYREDGTIYNKGTEDFSIQRLKMIHLWRVKTPSGEINKGGHRIWEIIDNIRALNAKDAKGIAKILYPGLEIKLEKLS